MKQGLHLSSHLDRRTVTMEMCTRQSRTKNFTQIIGQMDWLTWNKENSIVLHNVTHRTRRMRTSITFS
jgi:hypothetical protein